MGIAEVSSLNSPERSTVEDVVRWATAMADKGIIHAGTARQKITGLTQLATVLGEDEDRSAKAILDALDEIAARWATKNQGSPDTMNTYRGKARSLLNDYFAYLESPGDFKVKRRAIGSDDKKVTKPKRPQPRSETTAPEPTPTPQPPPSSTQPLRTFPLGPDREDFAYRLPAEGLNGRDVLKIACHLLTLASDFDPGDPAQAQIFALRKREAD